MLKYVFAYKLYEKTAEMLHASPPESIGAAFSACSLSAPKRQTVFSLTIND
jgi:hypothetical protein